MVLRNYLLPAFGSTPMKDVIPASVRAFIRTLEESKSGAMIRKIKGVGSAIRTDAADAELVTGNVWRGHRTKQHVARPRAVMTVHEYRMIIEAMHPHYRLLIRTLGETELRWSEAMRLVPDDIIGRDLHVRQSKNGKPRRCWRGTPRQPVVYLWVGTRGPLSPDTIHHMLRMRGTLAGIEGVGGTGSGIASPAGCQPEADEQSLISLAGWSGPDMVKRYTAARATGRAVLEYRRIRLNGDRLARRVGTDRQIRWVTLCPSRRRARLSLRAWQRIRSLPIPPSCSPSSAWPRCAGRRGSCPPERF